MTHIEEHSCRDSTKWFARGKALHFGISDFPASRTTAAATFVTLWAGAGRSDSGRVWSLERLPALCYRSSAQQLVNRYGMKNPRRGRGNPLRDDTFRQQEMACVQTIRISPAKTDAVKVPKRAEPCGRAGYVPGLNAIALLVATPTLQHDNPRFD
jgi:hypothetical protein